MIVGMHQFAAAWAAEQLGGPIGDHFVGVHVRRGAGAGLKDIDREVGVEPAIDDVGRGLRDGGRHGRVEEAQGVIDRGGGV
jgi:hypothetical protein